VLSAGKEKEFALVIIHSGKAKPLRVKHIFFLIKAEQRSVIHRWRKGVGKDRY